MKLCVMGLLVSIGFLCYAIYLRICYFKHEAVCVECLYWSKGFTTYPTYEYKLTIAGKEVTYKNRGTTVFFPREGKRNKILICKKDYDKVVGYAEYVVHLFAGILFSILFTYGIILSL